VLPINIADFGTGVCRMKYFNEREFFGLFSSAGWVICVLKKGITGGPWLKLATAVANKLSRFSQSPSSSYSASPSAASAASRLSFYTDR